MSNEMSVRLVEQGSQEDVTLAGVGEREYGEKHGVNRRARSTAN